MKKRIALIATTVVLASLILVGGTLAWFTDQQEVTNHVTVGNVSVQLNDTYNDQTVALPSQTVSKIVSASNNGQQPIYVRIRVEKYWSVSENSKKQLDGTEDPALIRIHFTNSADWAEGESGVYYYQHPLEASQTTSNLFESFTLDEKMDNRYDLKQGNIRVVAEAVQVKNFETKMAKNDDDQIIGWGDLKIEDTASSPFNN